MMKICLTLGLFICVTSLTVFAQDEPHKVLPLWENGAPGFEDRKNEPELAEDYWVKNIHNPSLTVFLPPKEIATGAAVVVCPGGGHRLLVFNAEGVEAAEYLNSIGVAAFVLKYRLAREEGAPYSLDEHPRMDGQRAMRLVRSRAQEWGIDPDRIGIMGFSAGGETAAWTVFSPTDGDPNAGDPVERVSANANFMILVYPGPLGMPETITRDAPPAFLICAIDDRGPARILSRLLEQYRQARVPAEVHIFAHGGHAFNMGNRSKLVSFKNWPQRLSDWMTDNYIFDPSQKPEEGQ